MQNLPILILIPISQNQFYIYQPKHVFFVKFIMAGEKSRPPKPLQKIPVGSQAHRALNHLPKADELFTATELACESRVLFTYFILLCLYIRKTRPML